jgi:GNAT superfamily N-acetyltransferase
MLMQSHLPVREKTAADQPWIEGLLRERWGGTVVVVHGARFDAAALPALVAGDRQGLATYCIDGEGELVTLDALRPRRGVGTALLGELVRRLSASGISTLRVTTTNDNLDALRFYQRRGFRLARLRCGALDETRRLKPAIPATGAYGIPLRDEIELRLDLSSSDWFQSCKPQVRPA